MNRRWLGIGVVLLSVGLVGWFWMSLPTARPLAPGAQADRVAVDKSARLLVLMRGTDTLKTYAVSLGARPDGHKQHEGDERTPEGHYRIDWRNDESAYHRALHISYPNASDRAQARGVSPGGDIMIHGLPNSFGWIGQLHRIADWTDGCIAVTNTEMDEIWHAVPNGTPIDIRP